MAQILICYGPTDPNNATVATDSNSVIQEVATGLYWNCINRPADTATIINLVNSANEATPFTHQLLAAFVSPAVNVGTPVDGNGYSGGTWKGNYYANTNPGIRIDGSGSITSIKAAGYNNSARNTLFTHNAVGLTHTSGVAASAAGNAPVEFTDISAAPRDINVDNAADGSTYGYVAFLDITYAVATLTWTLEAPAGTPYTSATTVEVRDLAGTTVIAPTTVTPNASGVCSVSDAGLTATTEYQVLQYLSDYSRGRVLKLTAA